MFKFLHKNILENTISITETYIVFWDEIVNGSNKLFLNMRFTLRFMIEIAPVQILISWKVYFNFFEIAFEQVKLSHDHAGAKLLMRTNTRQFVNEENQ